MEISKIKIVTDSSSDVISFDELDFCSAPLRIITADKEYVDNKELDVENMVNNLLKYSGKSSTACPGPDDWIKAFGEAEYVFCITITSNLSGSYNSACTAKELYEEQHPERHVYVFDSLSTGAEMKLIIEKMSEFIKLGIDFEEACKMAAEYSKNTALLFMLESMKNLANNGRVNPIVAKAAGLLGIRIVGKASDVGTLEILEKCRGGKKAVAAILENMKRIGFSGGKVIINHCFNPVAAENLKNLILAEFKNAEIRIGKCRGLCSFYAEKGGMIIGFEHN